MPTLTTGQVAFSLQCTKVMTSRDTTNDDDDDDDDGDGEKINIRQLGTISSLKVPGRVA